MNNEPTVSVLFCPGDNGWKMHPARIKQHCYNYYNWSSSEEDGPSQRAMFLLKFNFSEGVFPLVTVHDNIRHQYCSTSRLHRPEQQSIQKFNGHAAENIWLSLWIQRSYLSHFISVLLFTTTVYNQANKFTGDCSYFGKICFSIGCRSTAATYCTSFQSWYYRYNL